jgi:hypothetical protein
MGVYAGDLRKRVINAHRLLMVCHGPLGANHKRHSDSAKEKRKDNASQAIGPTRPDRHLSRRRAERRHARQERDQASRNYFRIWMRGLFVGECRNKRGQPQGRGFFGQASQLGSFPPRIDTQARQHRKDAEQHSIFVFAYRRE